VTGAARILGAPGAGLIEGLAEPWRSELMRLAFAEAVLAGVACAVLGCFVLVRRLAFLGESISHTVVLGAALALAVGLPLAVGGVVVALATAGLTGAIASDRRFTPDGATGVLLPTLFGAGVALLALAGGARRLEGLLFGSILGVGAGDVTLAAGLVVAVALVLWFAGKELVLVSFDRATAEAVGLRVGVLDGLLLALLALAVVVGLRAVGGVLLAGVLLGPPLAARLVCRTFGRMLAVAAVLAALAGVAGLYLSWHFEVGAGPAIVLVLAAGVAVAAAGRGVLSARDRRGGRAHAGFAR
jgi:manganese/iron transport system permease protein